MIEAEKRQEGQKMMRDCAVFINNSVGSSNQIGPVQAYVKNYHLIIPMPLTALTVFGYIGQNYQSNPDFHTISIACPT